MIVEGAGGLEGAMAAGDPERLGGYWVARRLGEGGQGVVYEAYDDAGARVAVKVLRRGARGRDFAREVAAAQRVASFCTARLIAADGSGPEPYLVSEYVEGPSLRRAVAEGGLFGGDRLHGLAIGVMTALVAIHEAGVVHRDLKPDNVLLSPDGPRVIDFGIARTEDMSLSAASLVQGTPPYMAPEVLRGERAGPPADVFAWAAVMLFAATGRSPFEGPTMAAVMHRVLTLEPDVGVLPASLREAVGRALAKRAQDRPPARDLLLGLLSVRGGGRDDGGLLDRGLSAAAEVRPSVVVTSPPLGAVAERVYDSLSPAERAVVPDILLRLIQTTEGGGDMPRTADPDEVGGGRPGHEAVLSALLAAGLVVREEAGVRLASAALPRAWPRLREWLDAERPGLAIHRRLGEAARLWELHDRRPGDLYQGSALEIARTWATEGRRVVTLNPLEERFLTEGVTMAARRVRRRRQVTAALVALSVVAAGAGVYAEARRREAVAERAAVAAHLDRAVARSLAVRAEGMRVSDPRTAMLLNVAAWRIGPQEPETRAGLRGAAAHPARDVFTPPGAGPATVYALSTTGTLLAGVRDGVATVWDVASGRQAARIEGVSAGARQAALNHDGSLLAVRDERSVRLWDVRSGRPDGAGFGGGFSFLAPGSMRFSPDGRFLHLPSGTGDAVEPAWIDLRTRRPVRAPGGGLVEVLGPGGRYGVTGLASEGATPVRLWDLSADRRRALEWLSDELGVGGALFSADGRTFATVRDGGVRFWDLGTGESRDWWVGDGAAGEGQAALSPDGALLVVDNGAEITTYRTRDGARLSRLPFATSGVEPPAVFAADGRTLRVLGPGGTVLTLRPAEPGGARDGDHLAVAVGGEVAAVVKGGVLEVRRAATGERLRSLKVLAHGEDGACLCQVAVSPDGALIAVGGFLALPGTRPGTPSVAVLDSGSLAVRAAFPLRQRLEGVAELEFSPDATLLAVAPAQAGDVDVGGEAPMELWRWRERRGTELRGVNAGEQVAFSPDGRLLIAGDGVVAELPSGRVVRRLPTAAGQSPAFAPRGGLLAMAGPAGVTLWDTRTWRPSGVRLDDRYPSAPAFSPDGRSLAASTPAGVRLWDVATGRAIGAFTPGEEAADLAFAPSGALLYAAGPYGEVRAEEVDPVRVARRVCALAGRELSREEWRRHIPELPYRRVCGHAR